MSGVLKFSTLGGGLFLEVRANDGDECRQTHVASVLTPTAMQNMRTMRMLWLMAVMPDFMVMFLSIVTGQ